MNKAIIGILCILSLLIVLSPVLENWKENPKDDFPLSYYPMFTKVRGEYTFVSHLYGIDSNNNYYPIPHKVIVKNSGFNSFRKTVSRIIKNGEAEQFCRFVSQRLSNTEIEPYNRIRVVRVVTSKINIDKFMTNKPDRKMFRVHAQCRVR